jgi:hypothetical protein
MAQTSHTLETPGIPGRFKNSLGEQVTLIINRQPKSVLFQTLNTHTVASRNIVREGFYKNNDARYIPQRELPIFLELWRVDDKPLPGPILTPTIRSVSVTLNDFFVIPESRESVLQNCSFSSRIE